MSKSHRVLRVDSPLSQAKVACTSQGSNHTGLLVHHRYGPCSSLVGEIPSPVEILRQDQYRVNLLRSQILGPHYSTPIQVDDSTIPARSGISLGTGNYIVTVGFGTPKKDMTLAFDTGSDLTWIQCQPCNTGSCYSQQEPIFDPSDSSSFTNIACQSTECTQLGSSGRCFQLSSGESTCQYSITYGDRSTTRGSFARDTLTLTPSDVVTEFLFGCGHENNGLFGKTAGLLGLGRRDQSLVAQTKAKFGEVFSYCLPSSKSSSGFLAFGSENQPAGIKYTELKVNQQRPSFYYIGLNGISVNGQPIQVDASTFSTGGTIIDSGTVITRLPDAAYAALRTAFRQAMPGYVSPPDANLLDTCYDMRTMARVAKITLGLEGLDLELDESGVLYQLDDSLSCLAFAGGGDDLTILGNTQQRTFGVVYDVPSSRLGFAPGACS